MASGTVIATAFLAIFGTVGAVAVVSASSVVVAVQRVSKKGIAARIGKRNVGLKGSKLTVVEEGNKKGYPQKLPVPGEYVQKGTKDEVWVVTPTTCDFKRLMNRQPKQIILRQKGRDDLEPIVISQKDDSSWGEEGTTILKQIEDNKIELHDQYYDLTPLRLERKPPTRWRMLVLGALPLLIMGSLGIVAWSLDKRDAASPILCAVAVGIVFIALALFGMDVARRMDRCYGCVPPGLWNFLKALTVLLPSTLCFYEAFNGCTGALSSLLLVIGLCSFLLAAVGWAGFDAAACWGRLLIGAVFGCISGGVLFTAGDSCAFTALLASGLVLCKGVQSWVEDEAAMVDGVGETILSGTEAQVEEIAKFSPEEMKPALRDLVELKIREAMQAPGQKGLDTLGFVMVTMDAAMGEIYGTVCTGAQELVRARASGGAWAHSTDRHIELMQDYDDILMKLHENLQGDMESFKKSEELAQQRLRGFSELLVSLKDNLQCSELMPIFTLAKQADVGVGNIQGMGGEAREAYHEVFDEPADELIRMPRLRTGSQVMLKEIDRVQGMLSKLSKALGTRAGVRFELVDLQEDVTTASATLSLARQTLEPAADGSLEEEDISDRLDEFVISIGEVGGFYSKVQERLMYRSTSSADTSLEVLVAVLEGYFDQDILDEVHREVLPLFERATEAVGVLEATCELLEELLRVQVPDAMKTLSGVQDKIGPVLKAVSDFSRFHMALENPEAEDLNNDEDMPPDVMSRDGDWEPIAEDERQDTRNEGSRALFLKVQESMDSLMNSSMLLSLEQLQTLCTGSILGMLEKMAKPRLDQALDGLLLDKLAQGEAGDDWWNTLEAADEFSDDAPPEEGESFAESVTDYTDEDSDAVSQAASDPEGVSREMQELMRQMSRGSLGSSPRAEHIIAVDSPQNSPQAYRGSAELAPVCPSNHVLRKYTCRTGYECDVCQRPLETGERILDCRECNWGMCELCVQAAGISWDAAPPKSRQGDAIGIRSPREADLGASRGRRPGKGAKAFRRDWSPRQDAPSGSGIVVGMSALRSRPGHSDDVVGFDESPPQNIDPRAMSGLRLGFMQEDQGGPQQIPALVRGMRGEEEPPPMLALAPADHQDSDDMVEEESRAYSTGHQPIAAAQNRGFQRPRNSARVELQEPIYPRVQPRPSKRRREPNLPTDSNNMGPRHADNEMGPVHEGDEESMDSIDLEVEEETRAESVRRRPDARGAMPTLSAALEVATPRSSRSRHHDDGSARSARSRQRAPIPEPPASETSSMRSPGRDRIRLDSVFHIGLGSLARDPVSAVGSGLRLGSSPRLGTGRSPRQNHGDEEVQLQEVSLPEAPGFRPPPRGPEVDPLPSLATLQSEDLAPSASARRRLFEETQQELSRSSQDHVPAVMPSILPRRESDAHQMGLQGWAERVNAMAVGSEYLQDACRQFVKDRVMRAHADGDLHTRNWALEPVPTVEQIKDTMDSDSDADLTESQPHTSRAAEQRVGALIPQLGPPASARGSSKVSSDAVLSRVAEPRLLPVNPQAGVDDQGSVQDTESVNTGRIAEPRLQPLMPQAIHAGAPPTEVVQALLGCAPAAQPRLPGDEDQVISPVMSKHSATSPPPDMENEAYEREVPERENTARSGNKTALPSGPPSDSVTEDRNHYSL